MNVTDFIDQVEDFDSLTNKEQVKLLSYFYCCANGKEHFSTTEIKNEFSSLKLNQPSNVSNELLLLSKLKPPVVLRDKEGWIFQRNARKKLDEIFQGSTHHRTISKTLRNLINEVNGSEQQKFLNEAISCFEIKSFRASIIMSWLLSLDVLFEYIMSKKLLEFNNAIISHGKYKKVIISKKDEFSDIKESDFIEICRVGKIITNDIRKLLDEKLGIRNTCAHPNSMVITEIKAIAIIEDLVLNIIKRFQ